MGKKYNKEDAYKEELERIEQSDFGKSDDSILKIFVPVFLIAIGFALLAGTVYLFASKTTKK